MSGTQEKTTVDTAPEEIKHDDATEDVSMECQIPGEKGDDSSVIDDEELERLREENRILREKVTKRIKKHNEKLTKLFTLFDNWLDEDSGDDGCLFPKRPCLEEKEEHEDKEQHSDK